MRTTVGLAHELGIDVVAEGVETEAQLEFLIGAGCKVAQGNYLGVPLPADRIALLLKKNIRTPAT